MQLRNIGCYILPFNVHPYHQLRVDSWVHGNIRCIPRMCILYHNPYGNKLYETASIYMMWSISVIKEGQYLLNIT
jgi:hypothetical protein